MKKKLLLVLLVFSYAYGMNFEEDGSVLRKYFPSRIPVEASIKDTVSTPVASYEIVRYGPFLFKKCSYGIYVPYCGSRKNILTCELPAYIKQMLQSRVSRALIHGTLVSLSALGLYGIALGIS